MSTMTKTKEDHAAYMRDWHARNPDRAKRYALKRNYSMTLEEFQALLTKQNGGCAVCGRLFENNQKMRANVDHNHETGGVRGLVCPRCNAILGRVHRDIDLLLAAVAYLEGAK